MYKSTIVVDQTIMNSFKTLMSFTAMEILFSSDSDSDDDKPRKKRSCWVRPYFQDRNDTGMYWL